MVVAGCDQPTTTVEDASLVVALTGAAQTSESGGSTTVTVALSRAPLAAVTVPVAVDDSGEGRVSPASLTFTPDNWNAPQTVTVMGVDDLEADGAQVFHVAVGPSASDDYDFQGLSAAPVELSNVDDESPGIIVGLPSGHTSETGTEARLSVSLASRPVADVVLALGVDDSTEGAVVGGSLTFTSANWNVPQTVTVAGVNDDVVDGPVEFHAVVGPASSDDPSYEGLAAVMAELVNDDDDSPALLTEIVGASYVRESGTTASIAVRLATTPTADVVIPVLSSDVGEGAVDVSLLTFTASNWADAQFVTVTGIDDFDIDGDQPFDVTFGPVDSTDAVYAALAPVAVGLENLDDDSPRIDLELTGGTTEAGGTATLRVSLGSSPTANVSVTLASSDPSEGSIASPTVVFTSANWSEPQEVTVTGVDDVYRDGAVSYEVAISAVTSADSGYAGLVGGSVMVSNADDDGAFYIRTTYQEGGSYFYVSHSWYHTMMTTLGDTGGGLMPTDQQWVFVPGLADPTDPSLVSIQPLGPVTGCEGTGGCYWRIDSAYPNRYPTCGEGSNRGYALCWVGESDRNHLGWVDAYTDSATYRSDATFRLETALNGDISLVSLEWYGESGRYVRHAAYQIFASTNDLSTTQRLDASFALEPVE